MSATEPAARIHDWQARFDRVLEQRLPPETHHPQQLHQAMRYSALAGGKRFRPVLVYATGQAVGLSPEALDPVAAAIEIITRILFWESRSADMERLVIGERIGLLVGTMILLDWLQARRGDHAVMVRWHWLPRALGYAALVLLTLTIGNLTDEVPFIYFQF